MATSPELMKKADIAVEAGASLRDIDKITKGNLDIRESGEPTKTIPYGQEFDDGRILDIYGDWQLAETPEAAVRNPGPLVTPETQRKMESMSLEELINSVPDEDKSLMGTVNDYAGQITGGIFSTVGLQSSLAKVGLVAEPGSRESIAEKFFFYGGQAASLAYGGALALGKAGVGGFSKAVETVSRQVAMSRSAAVLSTGQKVGYEATTGLRAGLSAAGEAYVRQMHTAPIGMLGVEGLAGGASMVTMEEMSKRYPNSPIGNTFASFGAGMAAGTAPSMIALAPTAAIARFITNASVQVTNNFRGKTPRIGKFTEKSVKKSIGKRVGDTGPQILERANAANVSLEVKKLMNVGELSGDQALLGLEADLALHSADLSVARKKRFLAIDEQIRKGIDDVADLEKVGPADVRDYMDSLVETRIQLAVERFHQTIEGLGPKVGQVEASRLAKVELDKALKAAHDQERVLWEAVPETSVLATPKNAQDELFMILSDMSVNRSKNSKELVNATVRRLLGDVDRNGDFVPGKLDDLTTVEELISLRSKIVHTRREEKAKDVPRGEVISILNRLDEAILKDFDVISPDASDSYNIARGFSRDIADRFNKGEVGKILGMNIKGDVGVADDFILEGVGTAALAGRKRVSDLLRAMERTGNDEAMKGYIAEYMKDQFIRDVGDANSFDPDKAVKWVASRREILDFMPELRRDFLRATNTGKIMRDEEVYRTSSESTAAVFLNAPPGKEVSKILDAKDPAKAVDEFVDLLKTDTSGQALAGGRKAYVDELINRSLGEARDIEDGGHFISGTKFYDQLNSPGVRRTINKVFNKDQRNRLWQIAEEMRLSEKSRKAAATGQSVAADPTGLLIDLVLRVAPAQVGRMVAARTGGGTVQTPSIFMGYMQRLRDKGLDPARAIIIDAVTNPDESLMRSILMDAKLSGRPQMDAAKARIGLWILNTAKEAGIDSIDGSAPSDSGMSEEERINKELEGLFR